MPLDSSIKTIKGVGDKRLTIFKKMGIETVGDLLYHAPFKYQEISKAKLLSQYNHGDNAVVKATIISKPVLRRFRKNFSIVTFDITDGFTSCKCVFFNQPYLQNNIYIDSTYIFIGRVDSKNGIKQLQNPTMLKDTAELPQVLCTYKLEDGIGQKAFTNIVKKALEMELGNIQEILPSAFRQRHNLPEINFTLEHLHFPDSIESSDTAKYRLAFEEMLMFLLALDTKIKNDSSLQANVFRVDKKLLDNFYKSLNFELTNAQKKVINEILQDMTKPVVMNRLIQGDVGSGKTVVAAAAMLIASKNNKQSAMMAPTDILATQHFNTLSKLLSAFDVKVRLLKSKITAKEKREILDELKRGDIDIVVGTHALIQKEVEYKDLGFVVTDEQHRFGVAQRANISGKGINPDTLVMSATPVPRTLALIIYGDLSISIIDELPKGRIPVNTRIVKHEKRNDMYNYIKSHLHDDNRAYIVCPLIEESDKLDLKSTYELFDELKENIFKNIPTKILHGKQSNDEKQEIMEKFRDGSIKCIISTTVIEVGLDVPEATFMVIENAERFGLAQLHQLRGRVGRGEKESWCFLVSSDEDSSAYDRLNIMRKTNDGFKIAEEDLKMRGPGQFMGFRQSGMMDPRVINMIGDIKLLEKVQKAITELNKDEYKNEKELLKKIADKRYKDKLKKIILN